MDDIISAALNLNHRVQMVATCISDQLSDHLSDIAPDNSLVIGDDDEKFG